MNDSRDNTVRFFVSPAGNGITDGTVKRTFRTLDEALRTISRRYRRLAQGNGQAAVRQPLEIVFGDRSDSEAANGRKTTFEYYVDTVPLRTEGDGTARAPWPTIDAAIDGIGKLHGGDGQSPRAGERICISPREAFTRTPLEQRRRQREVIARTIFMLMTLLLVAPVLAILIYLCARAWPALSAEFLLTNPKNYMTAGGIWAPLVGTFFLVLISLLVSAPVGVLAGVYLNEYARDNWFTRIINLAVVNLAGVPSIVHALFGVGAFVLFAHMGKSLLAASCTLAVMTLPVIITSTREALAAVPMAFREACWNMGASRWQTIRTIVLPNSLSGILTGVILQVSRAAGETAPILFTGAVFFAPVEDSGFHSFFPYGLGDTCMALSMHLFTLSTQVPNVPDATVYGTAVVLIGLVLVVNSLSIGLRVYLRSRKRW